MLVFRDKNVKNDRYEALRVLETENNDGIINMWPSCYLRGINQSIKAEVLINIIMGRIPVKICKGEHSNLDNSLKGESTLITLLNI